MYQPSKVTRLSDLSGPLVMVNISFFKSPSSKSHYKITSNSLTLKAQCRQSEIFPEFKNIKQTGSYLK